MALAIGVNGSEAPMRSWASWAEDGQRSNTTSTPPARPPSAVRTEPVTAAAPSRWDESTRPGRSDPTTDRAGDWLAAGGASTPTVTATTAAGTTNERHNA